MRAASYMAMSSFSNFQRLPSLSSASAMSVFHATTVHRLLLPAASPMLCQAALYKCKKVLKRRCPYCYFVRRGERLFVECKVKPRHKQMEKLSKHELKMMRED